MVFIIANFWKHWFAGINFLTNGLYKRRQATIDNAQLVEITFIYLRMPSNGNV